MNMVDLGNAIMENKEPIGEFIGAIGTSEALKKILLQTMERIKKGKVSKGNRKLYFDGIEAYLTYCWNKHFYMNTIVFKGKQKNILELYIPLTLYQDSKKEALYIIDNIEKLKELICTDNKIMIIDTAGMGKSTIVKYLTLQIILYLDKIPVVVELRNYDGKQDIEEYILSIMLNNEKYIFTIEEIKKLAKSGDLVLFLDGFDEILEVNKGTVVDKITKFSSKFSETKVVLTSRDENILCTLGGFIEYKICPLKLEEAYSLIRKYDQDGELSKMLIERIEIDSNMDNLKELLTNPLLVSLLYKAFEYKNDIPYKKYIFYKQVYDALFEDHDIAKGGAYKHKKNSGLDIEGFRKVLNKLGFVMLKGEVVECDKTDLLAFIDEALTANPDSGIRNTDYLYDLVHAVPIFIKDGENYRWAHKSFCEYFAACFICEDSKGQEANLINSMYTSGKIQKYMNVLDFCFDMSPLTFRKEVVYDFLKSYTCFAYESFQNDYFKSVSTEVIETMKCVLFLFDFYVYYDEANRGEMEYFIEAIKQDDFREMMSRFYFLTDIQNTQYKMIATRKNNMFIYCLLLNKGYDITKTVSIKKRNISRSTNEALQAMNLQKYLLDDSKDNPFNQKGIIDILAKTAKTPIRSKILDYDKCLKLLNIIEKEKEAAADDDFFTLK